MKLAHRSAELVTATIRMKISLKVSEGGREGVKSQES